MEMKYTITYECVDGNNQTEEIDGTLEAAIDRAVELVCDEEDMNASTMTWSIQDEENEVVAEGAGNVKTAEYDYTEHTEE
jgi:hypothetical protein